MRLGLSVFALCGMWLMAQEVQRPELEKAPQERALYTYAGKPVGLKPSCRPEELTSLGLACSEDDPCDMLLELVSAEALGSRLILAGNLHTASTTVESLLLVSEDGGKTWTEPHVRVAAATFDQIQFIDFETGWIAGQTMLALPRDPFFLISRDGGKAWRKYPVFSESRVGTVEGFWFTSKNQGLMSIDRLQSAENGMRYELYETMTGGDSWMLKQISGSPIAIKRPEVESDVRVRPDAAVKSYRVERRSGDKWQTLSLFAIAAGECKPPAPSLPEPPAEQAPAPAPEEPPAKPRGRR